VLTVLQGIQALVDHKPLVIGSNYVYRFNATGWGWIHIAAGILLGIVAVALITGSGVGSVFRDFHGVHINRRHVYVAAVLPMVVHHCDRAGCHRHLGGRHVGHDLGVPEKLTGPVFGARADCSRGP
jgi:hypothetical protein